MVMRERVHGSRLVALLLLWAAPWMLSTSCSERTPDAATEVLVVVRGELQVPDDLDFVEVRAIGPDGSERRASSALNADAGLPKSVSLVHTQGPLSPLIVVVSGQQNGREVVIRSARLAFEEGRRLELDIWLLPSCINESCAVGTCTEQGCASDVIDPGALPALDGDFSSIEGRDARAPLPDAASVPAHNATPEGGSEQHGPSHDATPPGSGKHEMDASIAEAVPDAEVADDANEGAVVPDAAPNGERDPLKTPRDAGDNIAISQTAAPHDAGKADAGGSLAACEGARVNGLCWYLGDTGASCLQTCGPRGGYNPLTAARIGTDTQGGSLETCVLVLKALGYSGPVTSSGRSDELGLGCHLWSERGWWLASKPNFDPAASDSLARVACACRR